MTGTIHTTSPKPRTQIIYGKWEVDGVVYKGRRIDVDTLCHLEWIDETPPEISEAAIDFVLLKPVTQWERDFIGQLATCLVKGWTISEKRYAVWNKICTKHKVTAKDAGQTIVSDASATPPVSHGKERGSITPSALSNSGTPYGIHALSEDELPF